MVDYLYNYNYINNLISLPPLIPQTAFPKQPNCYVMYVMFVMKLMLTLLYTNLKNHPHWLIISNYAENQLGT